MSPGVRNILRRNLRNFWHPVVDLQKMKMPDSIAVGDENFDSVTTASKSAFSAGKDSHQLFATRCRREKPRRQVRNVFSGGRRRA